MEKYSFEEKNNLEKYSLENPVWKIQFGQKPFGNIQFGLKKKTVWKNTVWEKTFARAIGDKLANYSSEIK